MSSQPTVLLVLVDIKSNLDHELVAMFRIRLDVRVLVAEDFDQARSLLSEANLALVYFHSDWTLNIHRADAKQALLFIEELAASEVKWVLTYLDHPPEKVVASADLHSNFRNLNGLVDQVRTLLA